MSRSEKKASRLLQIEALLLAHPEGLTQAEIARKLQVHRATIGRYIPDLEKVLPNIYIDDLDGNKWKLDRERYLIRVQFNLHEALAVHLASRLLATRMDKQNPHAAAALRKLGISLEELAPQISRHVKEAADIVDDATQSQDPRFIQVLEKLALAWAERRKVHVWHRYEKTNTVHKYLFAPYFIEPYAIGQTVHVIGKRDGLDTLRTFKVERIERIEEVKPADFYQIPETFNPRQLLSEAWGIWYTEDDPQEVVLRFSKDVASRVRETKWHGSERVTELEDGRLLWQARIAEPQEMLPWTRGWGADVEVLEPDHLRKRLERTAKALAKTYGVDNSNTAKMLLHLPYAKTNPDDKDEIHLLLYHLIDVGQVAAVVWQDVLTESIRIHIATLLHLEVEATGQLLCFLASLHDIGKAGPAYQDKYAPDWLKQELVQAGLTLRDNDHYSAKTQDPQTPHATVSMWFLRDYLSQTLQLEQRFANNIATALGGHHGAWPPPRAERNIDDSHYPNWQRMREDIAWMLRAVFRPPANIEAPQGDDLNIFLAWFSGFVSVADWLGSRNKECFGFVERPLSVREYAQQSHQKAKEALQELGWLGWQPTSDLRSFGETFAYLNIESPRPLQAEVIDAAKDCEWPVLLILEAMTGIGKTETAVYLADSWLQRHHGRGLYIAMPTQATSNQMFSRIKNYLAHRYPDDLVNTHLIHGQANWLDQQKEIELQTVGDDGQQTGVAAMSWFKPRKRTLLAPFGVGTVDQTLLSILQTKHFFVRLFALGHKVIIFDEVHAYDTFMSTLFQRLLAWLRAMGTSVIVLSATLPSKTKQALVEAYTGQSWQSPQAVYPALTVAVQGQPAQVQRLTPPPDYTLEIETTAVSREPESLVKYLEQRLVLGGCTAIICNTVGRAQELYRALQQANLGILEDDLILFHARFPPAWRKDIEAKVLRKFGKPDENGCSPHRPAKAIVIATQVIEQSLDLDFDIMITDLAPIDLILQRAGRLHRHERGKRLHPHRLIITHPTSKGDELDFGNDAYVYEPYILYQTWRVLQRSNITIPTDTVDLIESVYSDEPNEALQTAYDKMQDNQRKAEAKAGAQLILEPNNRRLLRQTIRQLEEDDPDVHASFRAQTRDIAPGVSIVCLQKQGDVLYVADEEGQHKVNLENKPYPDLVKRLLQHTITVHRRDLVNALLELEPPTGWQQDPSLRHHRAVSFENGRSSIPNTPFILQLSREYGLEIFKEEIL